MSANAPAGDSPSAKEIPIAPLPDATMLAVDRTRLAFERTMMAWVRTATSLIAFGFTVYKFFEFEKKSADSVQRVISPREFAMIMISIGVFALVLATIQHRRSMQVLRAHYRGASVPTSLAAVLGALIAMLGILSFAAVILRR